MIEAVAEMVGVACFFQKNLDDKTALDIAEEENHLEAIQFIKAVQ